MKTMKRTLLVGASMFAMMSGVYAQAGNTVSLETFQTNWQQTNNVTTMTPELYEQMKTAWVNANVLSANERTPEVELTAAEKQSMQDALLRTAMGLPADYPLMQDTGNPVVDAENYLQAKLLWMENNQAEYNQMITPSTLTDVQKQEIRQLELNNQN